MPKKSRVTADVLPSGDPLSHEGGWFIDLSDRFTATGNRAFPVRIIGIGEKPANQFTGNPLNVHVHPEEQRKVLREILGRFGFVTGAVENRRTGHLLDGHERVWEAMERGEDTTVPYILIDIDESEENDLLMVFDRVGEMVKMNTENLSALMQQSHITEETPALSGLINAMAQENGIVTTEPKTTKPNTIQCPECGHEFEPMKKTA